MDFVADQLADGRKIRTLTIIDLFTRECLGIEVGFSPKANDVVAAMNRLEHARHTREDLLRQWIGVRRRPNGLELPRFRGQVVVLVSDSRLLDVHRSYQ